MKKNIRFILSSCRRLALFLIFFLLPAAALAVPPVELLIEAEVGAPTKPSTGGALTINRIELQFENGQGSMTVPRNGKLKAKAFINFTGNGVLNGQWVVDGRPIQQVSRNLIFGTEIVLETEDIPPLPTFEPGQHTVAFEITNPLVGFILPVIRYFVKTDSGIRLDSPLDGATLFENAFPFAWSDPKNTGLYRILVWEGERAVINAMTKRLDYRPPQMLREKLIAGKDYRWEVIVDPRFRTVV